MAEVVGVAAWTVATPPFTMLMACSSIVRAPKRGKIEECLRDILSGGFGINVVGDRWAGVLDQ